MATTTTEARCRNDRGLVPLDVAQKAADEALAQLEDWRVGVMEVMEDAREEGGLNGPAFAETFAPCLSKATFIRLAFGFNAPSKEPEDPDIVLPIDGRPLGDDVLWPIDHGLAPGEG